MQLEKSIKGFCCSGLESRVDFNHKNLTKINARYNSKEEAMKINDNINAKYFEFVNSYYVTINSLEIISNKTNKSKAIDLLINKLKLSKENVYTIEEVAKAVSSYNNVIAINLGDEVYFVDTNAWLIKRYTSSQVIEKIILGDGVAGIIYRDKIEIVNL